MEVYKLKKPDLSMGQEELARVLSAETDILSYTKRANTPEYLYWDKVRYLPRPDGMMAEHFWELVKFTRLGLSHRAASVVRDSSGKPFTWQPLPDQDYFLHQVDLELGGSLHTPFSDDATDIKGIISRGVMEEAIASSQLEGASTTRQVAKRMLLEKRRPRGLSEQMILNNYNAMILVEEELRHQALTEELLLNLHAILTRDTVNTEEVGRFRKDDDRIVVVDDRSEVIYHIPPPQEFLETEIKRLVQYANVESDEHPFVHPVIKAIILHFWIGYLHPFTDGNGRLARTIFYWYLLRRGYWAFSYLPISRVIRKSPAQYRDAYVYTEQDDNDLTYFVDYNIRKIQQAKREFLSYVRRKETENRGMAESARSQYRLNDRQIQLLRYLHKNAGASTTIKTHCHVFSVSRPTAKLDLELLESLGFLRSEKVGVSRPFYATERTTELFSGK